jgi:spermidine synthase
MSTEIIPAGIDTLSAKSVTQGRERITAKGLKWYFAFFLLSGVCSILYELVWLRLAMARFGVTTALVSIALSTFMAGLGLGSWAAGGMLPKYIRRLAAPPLQVYAVTELLIGCSAVVVPLELRAGRYALERLGSSLSLSSSGYYIAAGCCLACTLIPWCALMGATIPIGMLAIRTSQPSESKRSFSFLYVANVLGAVAGAAAPLLLIEIWGFTATLRVGMLMNISICAGALWLANTQSRTDRNGHAANKECAADEEDLNLQPAAFQPTWQEMARNGTLWLLFATGLTSMGMELVWTRLYTYYIGTFVYSFAQILGVYLIATFLGSALYRFWSRRHGGDTPLLWLLLGLTALVPLLYADPRMHLNNWLRIPFGISLFSGLLGFLTPGLVDHFSEGDPNRAGIGYAVNVLGCILGPLVAGFLLLPYIDERYALMALAVPWLAIGAGLVLLRKDASRKRNRFVIAAAFLAILCSAALTLMTRSYIQEIPGAQVKRDSTATVVAAGEGMDRRLYVNGIGMTRLTPITKMMAALPLTFLDHPAQKALVICFGMGTTHRSMLSWGIDSTAVDLVPSVPEFFSYYHADAPTLVTSPHSHIVVDDGRRFLERTTDQYDVIVIDPPPPIAAAGSSLLYSREFYAAAKRRLRSDGILVQWYPGGDRQTGTAVTRALTESFPYVRAFLSLEGWGVHYLASMRPIPARSAAELASRMPAAAAADFMEWGPLHSPQEEFAALLQRELNLQWLLTLDKNEPALQDDLPVNEYYLVRYLRHPDLKSGR